MKRFALPLTLTSMTLVIAMLLSACQSISVRDEPVEAFVEGSGLTFGPDISAEDFSEHVKVLASDAFGGRAPGSVGEDKTLAYLSAQFRRLGLMPGNGESYFQDVPMVKTTVDTAQSSLKIHMGEQVRNLKFGDEMVVGSRTGQTHVSLKDSPLVFVGYGVNAPEHGWNDYEGIDVRGKTVVMLVNDPGFHSGDTSLFEGRRMTYYGRWTYKFEEAARRGASAALIIHDTAGAAYGWDVVKSSWSGTQFDLPNDSESELRLPVQGWITTEVARSLFTAAGQDFDSIRVAAGRRGFKAVPLGDARLDVSLTSHIERAKSRNVIAKLPGSRYPDEAIVYSAHWDHLGTHDTEGGDNIYNGAIDNATGVAAVLEIAERFTVQTPKPERSLIFLFVTLEESGLLGSQYYAAHPVIPLANTVAVVNLDAMPVVGPTRDFIVVGLGQSELEDVLRPIAEKQGRTLIEESAPEKGQFFRSDHFSFAKAGVPALYTKGGIDHIEKGQSYGVSMLEDYTANRYHKGSDNFDPKWDLRGIIQDLEALYQVGEVLSLSRDWPNYRTTSSFRAARDASRSEASR